jgi:hypothetical protein
MEVIFFQNGNTACFDKAGKQIPILQKSYMGLYCKFLESQGVKPEEVEFTMPSGAKAKAFKVEDGWNWEIK